MARPLVTQPLVHWKVETVSVHCAPDRLDLALTVAACCALLAPAVSLALGVTPAWLPGADGLWRAAHLSASDGLDAGPFSGAIATQVLIFVAAFLVWRAVTRVAPRKGWLLPEWRADAQARDLFDHARAGALIYVAREQQAIRILVDPQVEASLPAGTVALARDVLVEGLKAGDAGGAIQRAAGLLQPRR